MLGPLFWSKRTDLTIKYINFTIEEVLVSSVFLSGNRGRRKLGKGVVYK